MRQYPPCRASKAIEKESYEAAKQRHEVICKAITHLAHDFKLCVVAEGIETEAQLQKIKELGCDVGQGYLFGKPAQADQITHFDQPLAQVK